MTQKVLIIEDEDRSRKLAADIVSSLGLDTMVASTAEEGLQLAMSEPAALALILMDQRLPGMSGVEALKILRKDEHTCKIPVVCITASVANEDRNAIETFGFDRIVAKPYHFHELTEVIQEFIDEE